MTYREQPASTLPIVVAFSGKVFGLDAQTGKAVWGREAHVADTVRLAVDGDLVFTLIDGVLECLHRRTGKSHWERSVKGATLAAQDGIVCVGTWSTVRAFSYDGSELWNTTIPGLKSEPVALAVGQAVSQVDQLGRGPW